MYINKRLFAHTITAHLQKQEASKTMTPSLTASLVQIRTYQAFGSCNSTKACAWCNMIKSSTPTYTATFMWQVFSSVAYFTILNVWKLKGSITLFFWPSVWQTITIIHHFLTNQLHDCPGHEGGILNEKQMLINKQSECTTLQKWIKSLTN